jgi:hypothetical protein
MNKKQTRIAQIEREFLQNPQYTETEGLWGVPVKGKALNGLQRMTADQLDALYTMLLCNKAAQGETK